MLSHLKYLRPLWRRVALCSAAAVSLTAACDGAPVQPQLRHSAATSHGLPPEAAQLQSMAPNRPMILLSRADFGGRDVDAAAVRARLARAFDAATLATVQDRQVDSLVESINAQAMTAMKIDRADGSPLVCVVTLDETPNTARGYAGALAGIPAQLLRDVPGSSAQWRMAALFHEAGHCGQRNQPYSPYDFVAQLNVETDADQRMLRMLGELDGYGEIGDAFRAMRTLGALHFSGPGHMTAVALYVDGEHVDARTQDRQAVFDSMQKVNAALVTMAGGMIDHRSDLHQQALAQELATLAQFTAAANHATHPVLRQRATMLADMRDLGITGFAQKYADQAAFVETVKRRSGDLLRQERDNPQAYDIFARASARLQDQGTLHDDPIASRFLSLYSAAVRQQIVPAVSGQPIVQKGFV